MCGHRRAAALFRGEEDVKKGRFSAQGTHMNTKLTSLAIAAMLSLSAAPAAFAQADEAMLARLKAVMTEQGTTLDWESVEEYEDQDGNEVTALKNARIGAGDEETVISQIELVEVTEQDGGWQIGTVRVPQHSAEDDGTTVAITDFAIDGLVLPAEGDQDEIPIYDSASLGALTVSAKGKEVFTLNDLFVEVTSPEDGGTIDFTGAAEAFNLNIDGIEDEASRAAIRAMGYEKLAGYFELAGSWSPDEGMLELSKYDITVNDAGTFGISLKLGGYTREFLASLREVQAQMASDPKGENSAAGMAMLGLMQQLTFHSARIQFNDDSLTNRALEYVAAQQGSKPADIANQAKAVVPFAMMQLNNPELTMMTTQAVSSFLDNPKNLVITAQPANPMPFALIAAGAMIAPQALPQQLGVKVLANE
jgi:hypothetical protein